MSNIALAFLVLLIISLVINPIGAAITNPTGFSFDVKENFPATNAGLKSGMIINSVNYEKISNYNEFIEKVYYIKPNEKIILGTKDKKYEIQGAYNKGENIKGWINISFSNESAISLFSDELGNSIKLIELLKTDLKHNYACTPSNCESSYSAAAPGTSKQISLGADDEKIIGFVFDQNILNIIH